MKKKYLVKALKDKLSGTGISFILNSIKENYNDEEITFKCSSNHMFFKKYSTFKVVPTCNDCEKFKRKLNTESRLLKEAKNIAKKNQAHLITKMISDRKQIVQWICENNHLVDRTLNKVRGSEVFCNKCRSLEMQKPYDSTIKKEEVPKYIWKINEQKRKGLELFENLVKEKNGKLLDKRFIRVNKKLLVSCENGHEWQIHLNNVRTGHWCPHCGNSKPLKPWNILAKEIAKKNKGLLLSKEIKTGRSKSRWRCDNGHEWETRTSRVINGRWCPRCAGVGKYSIKELNEISSQKGGKCVKIVEPKVTKHTRVILECSEKHQWETNLISLTRGSWCPTCAQSTGERLCREVFEQLFEKEFPNTRPSWLLMSGIKKPLELDGYNEELKIAFEHQGYFHENKSKILAGEKRVSATKKRDSFKLEACKKRNIILIQIPEVGRLVKAKDLIMFIIDKLKKNNIVFKKARIKNIDINKAYLKTPIAVFRKQLEERDFTLLDNYYKGARPSYKIKCKYGHIFKRTKYFINNNSSSKWCYHCTGKYKKITIEEVNAFADKYGYKLLSTKYESTKKPLRWRCKNGHIYEYKFESAKLLPLRMCKECRKN